MIFPLHYPKSVALSEAILAVERTKAVNRKRISIYKYMVIKYFYRQKKNTESR